MNFHPVEFSRKKKQNMIWTWPQIALSYCELRLKPHPLIQFYFSVFHYLLCEGWHVRLCISRMAFNSPFAASGLTWIKCVLCSLICMHGCVCVYVRVYVCACLLRYHTTWNFSPSRRQLSLNILIMQSYPRESERSWTECIIRSSYLCHTARSY